MAESISHNDEEIRAAARYWLRGPFGDKYRERLAELRPGDLAAGVDNIVTEIWDDVSRDRSDEEHVNSQSAEQFEAMDALEYSGFHPRDKVWSEATPPKERDAGFRSNPLRYRGYPAREVPAWHPSDIKRTKEALREVLTELVGERWAEFVGGPRNAAPASAKAATAIGPKFSTVLDNFITDKTRANRRRPWTVQTVKQARAAFRLLEEFCGDRPVDGYTRSDVDTFREKLRVLPFSHGKGAKIAALDAIAAADEADAESKRRHAATGQVGDPKLTRRLKEKTMKRHFSPLSQLWRYLKRRGDVSEVIFADWDFEVGDADEDARDPWSAVDLATLFKSVAWRCFAPDSAEHWLPLIALHEGLRLEEIASLRVPEDIGEDEGIHYFNIRPHFKDRREAPDPVVGKFKPKSRAGTRRVPIHSWLLSHGLLELIKYRQASGDRLLFPTLTPGGPDGKLSAGFSKSFSNLKIKLGVPSTVDFHSFRTTFRTKIAEQKASDEALNALTGHETPPRHVHAVVGEAATGRGVGAQYERPSLFSLKVLQEIVDAFTPPLPLSFIKPVGPAITRMAKR